MNNELNATDIPRVGPGEPITEPLPYEGAAMQVYAYLNIDHPAVAWASYRGVLISAQAAYQPPKCPISMMFAGMITYNNSVRLRNEMLIETCRQQFFSNSNSRLTGMYFFEDMTAAQRASVWGPPFSVEYLAELAFYPSSHITKVDSNWITYAPLDKMGNMTDQSWMPKYWAGEAYPELEPLWELIGQGRAIVCGTDLRIRSYNNLYQVFPTALCPLEMGRLAALLGSDMGSLSPWLIRNEDETMTLRFYLNMADAENGEFLDKLGKYNGPKNHRDLAVGGEYFGLPHFNEYKVEFKMSNGFFHSVHSSSNFQNV